MPTLTKDQPKVKITFRPVSFWPNAFHVYKGAKRVGIVNARECEIKGKPFKIWFAHNEHFLDVGKDFPSRNAAANALVTRGKGTYDELFK